MANRFILNETSYFGAGARENLVPELTGRGLKKVMFVTDKVLLECGVATKVTAELDKAGIAYEIYSDVKANPTVANVQTGVAKFKEMGADSLVAVGGGSVMDTAKAVGIIIANPDFADVKTIMLNTGMAHMGTGRASGENKAEDAAKEAIQSPLLETSIEGARGVIINITGGSNLGLHEVNTAAELIQRSVDPEANIIFGAVIDESLDEDIVITLSLIHISEPTRH